MALDMHGAFQDAEMIYAVHIKKIMMSRRRMVGLWDKIIGLRTRHVAVNAGRLHA